MHDSESSRDRQVQQVAEEAERRVLGALLLHPEAVHDCETLRSAHLALPKHQRIYRAIRTAYDEARTTDPIAVGNVLSRDRGALEEVGGHQQLMELMEGVIHAADVSYHAEIVKERADRRRIERGLQDTLARVEDGNATADELRERLQRVIEPDAQSIKSALAQPLEPVGEALLSDRPEPREYLVRHPVSVEGAVGDGLLPRGKVGILASAGGLGKTMSVVEVAVAAVTGRQWFGHYTTHAPPTSKVLLLLAEEDAEEVHRRLYQLAQSMGLSADERREVASRLVIRGLAGEHVALARDDNGCYVPTKGFAALSRNLASDEWALIVVDPLSHFAGVSIDKDSDAGTFVVGLLSKLALATGATVLAVAHSSKASRTEGRADVRGVSAITDAARWVATLVADNGRVKFQQVKSNYSRPMSEPLVLHRDSGGLLRAASAEEVRAGEAESDIENDIRRIVDAVAKEGVVTSKDSACGLAGIKLVRGRAAFSVAVERRWIINEGTKTKPRYTVPNQGDVAGTTGDDGTKGGGRETPHTPRDVGTASAVVPRTSAGAASRDDGAAPSVLRKEAVA